MKNSKMDHLCASTEDSMNESDEFELWIRKKMANKRQWTYFGMPHQFFKNNLIYDTDNMDTVFYRNILYAFCKFRSAMEFSFSKTVENESPLFYIEVDFDNNNVRDEFFFQAFTSHPEDFDQYISDDFAQFDACEKLNEFVNTYFFEIVDDLLSVSQTLGFLLFPQIYPPDLVRSYYNITGISKLIIDKYNEILQLKDPQNSFVIKMKQFCTNQIEELPDEILNVIWNKLGHQKPIQSRDEFLKRIAERLGEQRDDFLNEIKYLSCHIDEEGYVCQSGPLNSMYSPIPASVINSQTFRLKVPRYKRVGYFHCSTERQYMKYKSLLAEWKTSSQWDFMTTSNALEPSQQLQQSNLDNEKFPLVFVNQTHNFSDSSLAIPPHLSTLQSSLPAFESRATNNRDGIFKRSPPRITCITGSYTLLFSTKQQNLPNHTKNGNQTHNLIVQYAGTGEDKTEATFRAEQHLSNSHPESLEAVSIQTFLEAVENQACAIPETRDDSLIPHGSEDQSVDLISKSVEISKEGVGSLSEEVHRQIKCEIPLQTDEDLTRITQILISESSSLPENQIFDSIPQFSETVENQACALSEMGDEPLIPHEVEDQSVEISKEGVGSLSEEVLQKIKCEIPLQADEDSTRITKILISDSSSLPEEQFFSTISSYVSNPSVHQTGIEQTPSNLVTDSPASPDTESKNFFVHLNNKTSTSENVKDVNDNVKEIAETRNNMKNNVEIKSEIEYDYAEFEEFLEPDDLSEEHLRSLLLEEDFEEVDVKPSLKRQKIDDDSKDSSIFNEVSSNNMPVKSEICDRGLSPSDCCIMESDDDIEMIDINTNVNSVRRPETQNFKTAEIEGTLLFSAISDVLIEYMDDKSYQSRHGLRKSADSLNKDDKKELLKFLHENRFLCEITNPLLYEILGHFKFLGGQKPLQYKIFVMELKTNLSNVLQELFTEASEESTAFGIYQILRLKFG